MSVSMPLPTLIAQSLPQQVKFRTLTAQFGDGYQQDVADGLNSKYRLIQPTWINLTAAQKTTVLAALDSAGSTDTITWQPPDAASTLKFKMTPEGYTIAIKAGDVFDVSAAMKQVF